MAHKKGKPAPQQRRAAKVKAREKRRAEENARRHRRTEGGAERSEAGVPVGPGFGAPTIDPSNPWDDGSSELLASAVEERLDAEDDEPAGEDEIREMIAMIAGGLIGVVQRTLDEETAAPARAYTERLADVDHDVATEDPAAEALGLSIAVRITLMWLRSARAETETPQLADELVAWVDARLGADAAAQAKKASGLIENADMDADERIELVDSLGTDLLPALIWLVAGLVASRGLGDVSWLYRYEEQLFDS